MRRLYARLLDGNPGSRTIVGRAGSPASRTKMSSPSTLTVRWRNVGMRLLLESCGCRDSGGWKGPTAVTSKEAVHRLGTAGVTCQLSVHWLHAERDGRHRPHRSG